MLKIETKQGSLFGDISGTPAEVAADVMTIINWTHEILSEENEGFMPIEEYVAMFAKFIACDKERSNLC